jgi:16S rRNA (cytosine967-C5)-methyltransferase
LSGHQPQSSGGTGQRATLAQQLSQVARCVQAVQAGRSLTDVLPTVPGNLRPGVQALTFHALRHLGTTAALVKVLAEQEPPAPTRALLCAALSLLLPGASDDHAPEAPDLEPASQRCEARPDAPMAPVYEAFTVVDQAVDAVRSNRATASHAALVNACLRRYLRERDALHTLVEADWEAHYNHPAWWVKRVRRDHPQHWQAILAASQHSAPLVLRVNTTHITRSAYLQHLLDSGLGAQPVGASGLVLERHVAVEGLPGYAEGWFSVQDTAAQLAAPLLLEGLGALPASATGEAAPNAEPASAIRPLRVLDACAAPGGKTAHLLEKAQAEGLSIDVLALEVDARRSIRITDNLLRLKLGQHASAGAEVPPSTARVQVADASHTASWWDGQLFDAILLDAPCTAAGIVRRHPDVRWLRRETDVATLVDTQKRILDALWPLLRPGGRMVYCTCSVFRAEGQAQVDSFLKRHTDGLLRPSPGHLLPGNAGHLKDMPDNSPGGHDGFFYARLDKMGA